MSTRQLRWRLVGGGRAGDGRTTLITLAACLLGLAAVQAAIRAGGLGPLSYAVPVCGAALMVGAWRRWEFGVQALMVVVVVEGAVRKWLMPSASEMVYFYKDALMVTILLSYLARVRKPPLLIKRELAPFTAALGAFVAYAAAALLTLFAAALAAPGGPHPLVGLLGFKVYCLYIPLAFLVPRMFPDKEKLIRFLKWYSLIVLPVAILCMMQFTDLNQSSAINRYATDAQGEVADIAMFSDSEGNSYVRVTGTFSFISGLTAYLPTMFALLLGLISLRREGVHALVKWVYYAAVGGTVVATVMTGSRAPVVLLIAYTAVFYALTSMRNLFRRILQVAVLGGLIFAGLYVLFPQALDALYERALGDEGRTGESMSRISEPFMLPLDEAYYAGGTGFGIGTTQNAAPAVMKLVNYQQTRELSPVVTEGEPGRVTLELGVIGYGLYMLLRLALLLTVCKVCVSLRDRESRVVAISVACGLAAPLLIGGSVVSHTQNVYQWFLVGVALALLNAEALAARFVHEEPRFSPSPLTPTARAQLN
jgi:hypothetical protein